MAFFLSVTHSVLTACPTSVWSIDTHGCMVKRELERARHWNLEYEVMPLLIRVIFFPPFSTFYFILSFKMMPTWFEQRYPLSGTNHQLAPGSEGPNVYGSLSLYYWIIPGSRMHQVFHCSLDESCSTSRVRLAVMPGTRPSIAELPLLGPWARSSTFNPERVYTNSAWFRNGFVMAEKFIYYLRGTSGTTNSPYSVIW